MNNLPYNSHHNNNQYNHTSTTSLLEHNYSPHLFHERDITPSPIQSQLCHIALQSMEISCDLADVVRVPRQPGGERENDAEHSWSLAALAPELRACLYPQLDNDVVQQFATVHELLEIVTGDVATFDLTPVQLSIKQQNEQQAAHTLLQRLPPVMRQGLERYEAQNTPEARFVRAVDKILPVAMDIVGQGVRVVEEDYGIKNLAELQAAHDKLIESFTQRFGTEFPELAELYANLAYHFETCYAQEKSADMMSSHVPERPNQLKEVERKFLVNLDKIPADIDSYDHIDISQGYLAHSSDGSETRVRRFGDGQRFELTVKSGGTVVRDEQNIIINEATFASLWPLTKGKRIEKTRYYVPYTDPDSNEHTIELDIYHGNLEGKLVTAEVEFRGRETEATLRAETFCPPEWCSTDISYDQRYKNNALASQQHGMLELSQVSM